VEGRRPKIPSAMKAWTRNKSGSTPGINLLPKISDDRTTKRHILQLLPLRHQPCDSCFPAASVSVPGGPRRSLSGCLQGPGVCRRSCTGLPTTTRMTRSSTFDQEGQDVEMMPWRLFVLLFESAKLSLCFAFRGICCGRKEQGTHGYGYCLAAETKCASIRALSCHTSVDHSYNGFRFYLIHWNRFF